MIDKYQASLSFYHEYMKPDQSSHYVWKHTLFSSLLLPILLNPGIEWFNIKPGISDHFLIQNLQQIRHSESAQINTDINFTPPEVPSRGRPTGTQTPLGSKGDCPVVEPALTAFIPQGNQAWALTTQAFPDYWFYIPYTVDQIHSVEFKLWKITETGDAKTIYSNQLNLTDIPGVIHINPRVSQAEIQVSNPTEEHFYEWALIVNCDDPNTPGGGNSRRVAGSILRYNLPEFESVSLESPTLEIAQLLAEKGIWYDALTTIATLRRQSDSEALQQAWQQLLESESVQLGDVIDKPIINCCQLQPEQ